MKLKLCAYLLFVLMASSICAETNDAWNTVSIKSICTFKLPPTMELQGHGYRKMMDTVQESVCYIMEYSYDEDRVVAQPKGLNKGDRDALKHFLSLHLSICPSSLNR